MARPESDGRQCRSIFRSPTLPGDLEPLAKPTREIERDGSGFAAPDTPTVERHDRHDEL